MLVQRPSRPNVWLPDSRVGVDVGVRRLATVADADGVVIEQVANPQPLAAALRDAACFSCPLALHERLTSIS